MMGRIRFLLVWLAVAGAAAAMAPDLEAVKAEENLFKRARKSVENADRMLDVARDAYLKGESDKVSAALKEVDDSIALAYQSLKDTGRKPRKISKHYKRAEIGSRKLLRRLETFRNEMSYLDREQIEEVIKNVRKIQQDLLFDVMGGGHK